MGKSIPSYLRESTKWQTNPTRSAASFPVRLFPLFSTFRGESRQRAGAAKVPRRVEAHRGIKNGGRATPMTDFGDWCLELLSCKGLESAFLEEIGLKHETVF